MNRVSIIDYGMGNIGSLVNMIRRTGGEAILVDDAQGVRGAEKLLLPGVGHFGNAMRLLADKGLVEPLRDRVLRDRVPILCICLGAQLVTESSEEGGALGLGWIRGRTVAFAREIMPGLRVPHMGWNDVLVKRESPLFCDMHEDPCFYFVHSYHIVCDDPADVLCTTHYGYEFVSGIQRGNIFATQFHPEKSHKFGLKLITNYVHM
jgi:glutamine amidotransferase